MHALIVGSRGVGKSTLIRRVLAELGLPLFGFETKKEDDLGDELRGSPVYIYDAGKERRQTPENLVAYCKFRCISLMPEAFDRCALNLHPPVPEGHVVLMDELGTLESSSEAFCGAVLELLNGNAPVIAAIKDKSTPFLDAVRAHPNCRCFYITEKNRETLYSDVLNFMKEQLYHR